MTLEQLQIFVKVVQAGSFTRAAELLHTQKSHVSRVVMQLEAELGVKLLERTTRTLSVTEMGREVADRALGILAAVEETSQLTHQAQSKPQGQLRLTCGVEFGMLAVSGWVDEYLATYPDVTAEVEHTSRVVDLVQEGFDLAIRIGPVQESRLVARRLGELQYGLFACPKYLEKQGTPADPEQLRQHQLVMFSGGALRRGWELIPSDQPDQAATRVTGPARLRVNNSFAVRDALLRSLGIGQLPLLIAADAVLKGTLVPLLPQWQFAPVAVHAVYPSHRYLSPKVRAFIDLALLRFPEATQEAQKIAAMCTTNSAAHSGERTARSKRKRPIQ
jgi:LysR family transcriptional regulator, regulator for bpeEF and oprC